VKVQFHWDRLGEKNENSSCWVRVSHPWAGKQWGAIFTPRIGQEVIVDFLEGDPDQPIVTGRVYNAEQMPPYALPAGMTQSGIKSRSSKGGSPDNFNEIRFEDKKGAEEFFMQAEEKMTIKVKGSESHTVYGSRSLGVGGNQTTAIKKDHSVEVTEGGYNIGVKKKQMFIDVPEAQFHVHGKKIWHIADEEFTADVKGNTIRMDTSTVSITGKSKITLTCGASSIELTPAGIKITAAGPVEVKGLPIKLNS
jgi:type VI secretion system secreted protein VgrG